MFYRISPFADIIITVIKIRRPILSSKRNDKTSEKLENIYSQFEKKLYRNPDYRQEPRVTSSQYKNIKTWEINQQITE